MNTALAPLRRLGELTVRDFLARYWQREAICIRQAIAGFANPISPSRLFALARNPEVESRLVSDFSGHWKMRHGPFRAGTLPSPRRPHWTLLVQGVDLHDAAVWALAARFRFLPAARFDDVMVSYASDGGGVGPHVDQYDVFLLQAQGRRRWRIATDFDPQLRAGVPLRLLANFQHQRQWVLEPGDLLYLPPGVAHEGIALESSITISIGFRLPVWQEVIEAWSERQSRTAPRTGRLGDRTNAPTKAPARLPATLVKDATRELCRIRPSAIQIRRTLLEHLSEPKPTVHFARQRPAIGQERFASAACRGGVVLDLRTRMLYQGADIAINGEIQPQLPEAAQRLLRILANRQHLPAAMLSRVGGHNAQALFALLHSWYRFGWLQLAAK